MAVQALAVVEWLMQLDIFRSWFLSKVVNVEMPQSAELCFERSKHGVVGVTCVAGFVSGDAMVLKMGGGKIRGVIHTKALAVGFHDVTRQTKRRALGAFHLAIHSCDKTKNRQEKQHAKRENLSASMNRNCRTEYQHCHEQGAE